MTNETKTIREWLDELPEPFREKAVYKGYSGGVFKLDRLVMRPQSALDGAFTWSNTTEGVSYWNDLYKSIDKEYRIWKRPKIT